MSDRIKREFYLLPRGEQRALILLSMLLIVSLLFRITVGLLPQQRPEGLEEFEREAKRMIAAFARADSLQKDRNDRARRYPQTINQTKVEAYQPVDINRADSVQLLPLPGIGPVFAGRIIKYRELLGGFISFDQLGEVYGISVETVQRIRNQVYIDSTVIRKIHLDSASFRELLRHPYLEYEDVKSLVEYRDFKGDIRSANELRINRILLDSTLQRMEEYFDYR
ncbi:MAG: helix-hairpin-helix domain-containing protein [Bacteroidales bacterium]|nr:helix-hairpin-helix domain-containing protein [Bacteroidales bacterium]